ncbi:hypothetical protein [Lutimonas sp.]|uniref:hypothetical protein n=1 Tax=Lutimonas sp. TaxID=1872403 RepID=UPI003D9AF7D9
MKKLLLLFLILGVNLPTQGQELLVKRYDANYNEISIDTFMLGDLIIIGHAKKGKNPHYFQGKITGIFKDRGVVRVFDYARSTRFMPIAGKKIPVDNIIAVGRPDEKKMKGRQTRAIAATAGQFLGSAVGGDAGDIIFWGSTAGNVVSDFVSREKLSTERIKCEIFEF